MAEGSLEEENNILKVFVKGAIAKSGYEVSDAAVARVKDLIKKHNLNPGNTFSLVRKILHELIDEKFVPKKDKEESK